MDYQLARLHEDVLWMLPGSATVVPSDIAALLRERTLLGVLVEWRKYDDDDDVPESVEDELDTVRAFYRCELRGVWTPMPVVFANSSGESRT